ncbi:MAG TPA: NADH-quinone oxidoreductase subunit L [Gemmatimonadales bacterium]|nr:NADH-quinone oxidoreductase subunit L [Gemmatimonadales bacterium]
MHSMHSLLPLLAVEVAPGLGSAGGAVSLVWLTVALPLLGFLVNGALSLKRPDAKGLVSVVGPATLIGAFAVAVAIFFQLQAAPPEHPYIVKLWSWLPVDRLQVDLAFQVDQLSTVMLLIITGVGSLIHLFSVGYMKSDPGYARYFAYLNLFVVFMLVLVLGSSFPVLFIGWEGVGLCSYLLIGFWFSEKANADAGKKAFIVNRIGDFGFLVAMFMIWTAVGSLDFVTVMERAPAVFPIAGATITAITLFLFLGCTGKSAQIPLYTWLPDAMAGPTPVSALIHAATMVTAGVYLVARTNMLFALAPLSSAIVAGVGALTALFAATIGLRQYDIKKVLAYSTVSQLGYMFLGVGTGAIVTGVFHLATHAFFKALLFLGSGSVIHAMHHAYHATHSHEDAQDMRNMGGLRKYMPWTWALMWIATLAIAGFPGFSGFFSKDEILAAAFGRAASGSPYGEWYYLFYAMGLVAALLTAIYMARLMAMTFHGETRLGAEEQRHMHEAPWIMTGPLVVLGVLSLVGGLLNLPAFVGGHHWLETWLEPVTAPAHAASQWAARLVMPHEPTEYYLIGAAVAIGIVGLLIGYFTTVRSRIVPANQAAPEQGFWRVLYHKWYVDELYDAAVVRPLVWLSRVVLWKGVDQGVIDGLAVNGTAKTSRFVGWVGSRLQTGQVGVYVVLFLVGALWILRSVLR